MIATTEQSAAKHAEAILEAEESVIASLMIDPRVVDAVAGIISPTDFSEPAKVGRVFALLLDMHDAREPIGDPVAVRRRLLAAGLLDSVGGTAGMARICGLVAHAGNAIYHAKQIARAASLRRIDQLGHKMVRQARNPNADPEQIIAAIEAEARRATGQANQQTVTLAEASAEALRRMDEAATASSSPGLPTGFYRLDVQMGGLFPGELIILAARPSIGKSAMGAQIATYSAEKRRPTMFVSLEMTAADIALRSMAAELDAEVRTLRSRPLDSESRAEAGRYVESIADLPLHLWSARGATMARIRGAARVMQATAGLRLLVVDYLGLVTATDRRKPRWEQITEVSADLKSLALELNIPVLALCQLGREAEGSAPSLNHLRDSGAIEQDADVVWLLHREDRSATVATLNVAKTRNGATGAITLGFDPSRTRFTDVEVF